MLSLSLLLGERRDEPSSAPQSDCPLCSSDGGTLIWRGAFWRLISVDDPQLPGYVRLVLNRHCTELTQLSKIEREQLLVLTLVIEDQMRDLLAPDKINHASLGNQVAHVHWHIVARFRDDPFFPNAIWAAPQRTTAADVLAVRGQQAQMFLAGLAAVCAKAVY
ncbi:MAG: HIT family protein [Burkholderiaceae bacterium]|jgi:diadenosine tetraphosphate (Ap4A) HIT family hydrolase